MKTIHSVKVYDENGKYVGTIEVYENKSGDVQWRSKRGKNVIGTPGEGYERLAGCVKNIASNQKVLMNLKPEQIAELKSASKKK